MNAIDKTIKLPPKNKEFEVLCERIRATLGAAGLTRNDCLATLPEARARVYAKRYGKNSASSR